MNSEYTLHVDGTNEEQVVSESAAGLLGHPEPIPTGWIPYGANAAGPDWVKNFWAHARFLNLEAPNTYLAVDARNAEVVLTDTESLSGDLQTAAHAFTGLQCTNPYYQGQSPTVPASAEVGRAVVQRLKTDSQAWMRICDRPNTDKWPYLTIVHESPDSLTVGYKDTLWMPVKNGNGHQYGHLEELKPLAAPWYYDTSWWSIEGESELLQPSGCKGRQ